MDIISYSKANKALKEVGELGSELFGEVVKVLYNSSTRNSISEASYLYINTPKLVKGVKYAFEFIPNTTFTQDTLQIGTNSTSASMVDTLGTAVNFVAGQSYWIENYTASANDLAYFRLLNNGLKIDSIKVYTYEKSSRIKLAEKEISRLSELEFVKSLFNSAKRMTTVATQDNYFSFDNPKLTQGVRYAFEFIPNSTFTQSAVQIGFNTVGAEMVDTLASNMSFTAGKPYWVEGYTARVENLGFIRFLANAAKLDAVNIYTYDKANEKVKVIDERIKVIPKIEDNDYHLATKLNASITELRNIQNVIDNSLSSLMQVQSAEGITKNVTIPSVGSRKKYMLRVGLHYGSSKYTPDSNDIFFDKLSKKDFSDVRFFDKNGKMLKAQLGKPVNMDLLADNNLDKLLKITSDGKIIGFQTGQGILISQDNGVTYTPIPNTANVTTNASTTYGRKDLYPIFIDPANNNIFAYAGGKLYKLLASDGYATIKEVLDFSWDNSGTKVYPDIQDHGMDKSKNGALIVGADYQVLRHARIFRSLDGGETFTTSWTGGIGTDFQHTHHVHADKFTNKVYAGIDDGGSTLKGARILVTSDDGATWTDITDNFEGVRGKDYYGTYFGADYRLGGGESYLNGGGMIYKADSNDRNLKVVVKGFAGVRSYADFGTDDLIVAGSQHARGNSVNQILISSDKGDSWDVIYSKQQQILDSSGGGFRRVYNATTLKGDTEPCIVLSKDFGNVRSMRLYKGGDHYYREAYIELENISDAPIEITAKTGYMMAYPYNSLNGRKYEGLVYGIPLNEGVGSYVKDSLGNIVKITGNDFNWDKKEEPVRYGDYKEFAKPLIPSSGIQLKQGTTINFGKIPQLNFSKGYTVTFWINNKNKYADPTAYSSRSSNLMGLFSAGNVTFFNRFNNFGYGDRTITQSTFASKGYSMMTVPANGYSYNDQYHFVAISVDNDGHAKVHVNGAYLSSWSILTENALFTLNNLSTGDFVIGSDNLLDAGFLSDIKFYNRVIDSNEIMEMYKGW